MVYKFQYNNSDQTTWPRFGAIDNKSCLVDNLPPCVYSVLDQAHIHDHEIHLILVLTVSLLDRC